MQPFDTKSTAYCLHTTSKKHCKTPTTSNKEKLENAEKELQAIINESKDRYLENMTLCFQQNLEKLLL